MLGQAGWERAASLRCGAALVRAAVTPRGLHGMQLQAPLPLAGWALVQAKINFHGRRDTLCICRTGPLGGCSGRRGGVFCRGFLQPNAEAGLMDGIALQLVQSLFLVNARGAF